MALLVILSVTLVIAQDQIPKESNFPNPTGEQVDMVRRMGELRQEYWEAYKEGGPKFEDIKLRFSIVLFYRDAFQMLTGTSSGVPDIFRSKEDIVEG